MASIYQISSGWRAQVRLTGQPSKSRVFKTRREAVAWARNEEAMKPSDLEDGGKPHTVSSLLAGYKAVVTKKTSSREQSLFVAETYLGHYRLAELTSKVFLEFIQKRRTTRFNKRKQGRPGMPGPATVAQDMIYLRTALKHGGALLASRDADVALINLDRAMVTARHLRLVGDSARRDRRPTDKELAALEKHFYYRPKSKTPMWDIIQFAIATAMRLGEIVGPGGITWEDFDEEARTIVVRARKDPSTPDGRDDVVPLLNIAGMQLCPVTIIKAQWTARFKTGRIFPYSEQTVGNAFASACKACAIEGLTFHDLRHDGISRMFEAGLDIPAVASVSGHRTWKNLQRYTHLRPSVIHNKSIGSS